jgi:ABC-2 type transport system ATP-binding protein
MLDKTSGEVKIDGNDISDQDAVRRTFGIVFQDSSLDDELTGWENMYFHAMLYGIPRASQEAEIKRLMEFVELRDFKDRIVKQYSGGMKRRLEIARGLLHHPKILYLDEPTVGLDPQSRIHIWEYLQKINQEEGLTIFLTTHYMDEVEKIADRIAVIDHGKIQVIGTLAELKEKTGKQTLDEVFIAMTGRDIREELLSDADGNKARMRANRKK